MSSHREAPAISKDPCADSTDLYAFVSPDKPTMVTMIANYVPLQLAPAGPNFYEFADDVLYEILIDNDGDGAAEITYQFQFNTGVEDPDTFLYNTGRPATTDPAGLASTVGVSFQSVFPYLFQPHSGFSVPNTTP